MRVTLKKTISIAVDLLKCQRGVSAIEYGILAGLIILTLVSSFTLVSSSINNTLNIFASVISNALASK